MPVEAASASQSTMPTQSSSSSTWVKGMPSQPASDEPFGRSSLEPASSRVRSSKRSNSAAISPDEMPGP